MNSRTSTGARAFALTWFCLALARTAPAHEPSAEGCSALSHDLAHELEIMRGAAVPATAVSKANGTPPQLRLDTYYAVSLAPQAGDTSWTVRSSWPSPSFGGDFLPSSPPSVTDKGFLAKYRIGNLALGRSLVSTGDTGASSIVDRVPPPSRVPNTPSTVTADTGPVQTAQISLIQPVDPYSQVNRATKYGFLFIGFTFLALLMFDVIGGARVSAVEYLLMGAALILFFVLLLAFAELIGFAAAYVVASAAIAGLNTAYSAAVLGSWRRAALIGGLLVGLYAVLYILLSLEAYSLLIGALLLFAALAGVMYATRRIDWGAGRSVPAA